MRLSRALLVTAMVLPPVVTPSVLGTYGFDRFGDTTLRDFGVYRIRGGGLEWAGAVRAP